MNDSTNQGPSTATPNAKEETPQGPTVDIGAEVWVLHYTHKHGDDISVFTNADAAQGAAYAIVCEYRTEFEVPAALSNQDASEDWYELTNGREDLEITRATTQG